MFSTLVSFKHAPAALALAASLFFPSLSFGASAPPDLLVAAGAMAAAGAAPPGLDGASPVAFNAQAALALPIGGTANLALPRLGTLAVVHDRDERHPNGDTTWVGHFRDYGTDYRVVVTSGAKGVAGRISSPDGEFSLLPGSGGAWLRDNQAAGLQPVMQEENDAVPVPPSARAQGQPARAAMAPAGAPPAQSVIDLMLVYTPGMVTRYGDGLQTRLNNLVAIANQAYIDSGVKITLRLVHTEQVGDYTATGGSLNGALDDLTYGNGAFSGVSALRKQYGADLVHLFISLTSTSQFCGGGLGWLNPMPSPDYGYSVSYDHVNYNSCDGNDVVMAHELGHNMGANHNRSSFGTEGASEPGYGYGYGITGKFVDIMTASYAGSHVVAKFSNPDITCGPDSDPCGIAPGLPNAADSAQTLNDNRETVAAYMPTASPTDCLFNWAEQHYSGLFAGGGPAAMWDVYTYRYYSATHAYLGVSSADSHVYYLGPDGRLQDEGPLAQWLPIAGCQ